MDRQGAQQPVQQPTTLNVPGPAQKKESSVDERPLETQSRLPHTGSSRHLEAAADASSCVDKTPPQTAWPYDPARQGPIRNRSCTDLLCLVPFFACQLCLVIVAVIAYQYGDPRLLLYPVDTASNLCGSGEMEGKSKLLYFDLIACARLGPAFFLKGCPTPQVCVSECPTRNYVWLQDHNPMAAGGGRKDNLICQKGVDRSAKTLQQLVEHQDCAAYYLNSRSILNRCLPVADLASLGSRILQVSGFRLMDGSKKNITGNNVRVAREVMAVYFQVEEYTKMVVQDLRVAWPSILYFVLLAVVVTFVWILLLRASAGAMVFLSMILFVGVFSAGAGICFWQYAYVNDGGGEWSLDESQGVAVNKEKFFLIVGIILLVILLFVMVMIVHLCGKMRIAVKILKECSRAVSRMMFTLLWPLFPFLLHLCVVVMWMLMAVYLSSISRSERVSIRDQNKTFDKMTSAKLASGTSVLLKEIPCKFHSWPDSPEHPYSTIAPRTSSSASTSTLPIETSTNSNSGRKRRHVVKRSVSKKMCGFLKAGMIINMTPFLQIFIAFTSFWLLCFIVGIENVTLAGAFASYYWVFNKKKDLPRFPLLQSFYRALRYHMGSIALGSLLIAVVRFLALFLAFLQRKFKKSKNKVAVYVLKCLGCCMWCLETFLRYITTKAYIMIAVMGNNFWWSCKNSLLLVLRNGQTVVVVDGVTRFVFFVSKLVLIVGMSILSFFFYSCRLFPSLAPSLNLEYVPVVLIFVATYLITNLFFNVYGVAVETIFLCFLQDLEMHDGSREKPYFMTRGLMKALAVHNLPPVPQAPARLRPQQQQRHQRESRV